MNAALAALQAIRALIPIIGELRDDISSLSAQDQELVEAVRGLQSQGQSINDEFNSRGQADG